MVLRGFSKKLKIILAVLLDILGLVLIGCGFCYDSLVVEITGGFLILTGQVFLLIGMRKIH